MNWPLSCVEVVKGRQVSIAGVTGRVPVGAVLTIGTKGPSGAPTDRDRFYIKVPDSTEGERACHPSFGPYNTARCAGCVKEGKTERNCPRCVSMRQTLRCVLVHASPEDCFEWNRKAQKIMGGGFAITRSCQHARKWQDGQAACNAVRWQSGVSGHRVSK